VCDVGFRASLCVYDVGFRASCCACDLGFGVSLCLQTWAAFRQQGLGRSLRLEIRVSVLLAWSITNNKDGAASVGKGRRKEGRGDGERETNKRRGDGGKNKKEGKGGTYRS